MNRHKSINKRDNLKNLALSFLYERPKQLILAAFIFMLVCVIFLTQGSQAPTSAVEDQFMGKQMKLEDGQAIQTVATRSMQTDTPETNQPKTKVSKQTKPPAPEPSQVSSVEVIVKKGDSFGSILGQQGYTAQNVLAAVEALKNMKVPLTLYPGQVFSFTAQTDSQDILPSFTYETGRYEKVTVGQIEGELIANVKAEERQTQEVSRSGVIHNSLFVDGSKAGLSDKLIMELASLFQWEIDFALDIRQGDSFKVIHEVSQFEGSKPFDGPIIAAEFTTRNRTLRGFRYEHSNGLVGYYDATGESLKKAFLKTPVDFARISSKFSLGRHHPVLHKIRAHKGVDYAASRGTPIKATGKGRIEFAGRKGGYGRVVIIKHNDIYSTLYAHMNSFAPGMKTGNRVKQGEVIGAVGSTGLATGPHLHYEFRRYGTQIDPLKVEFPQAESLSKSLQPEFKLQIAEYVASFKQQDQLPKITSEKN